MDIRTKYHGEIHVNSKDVIKIEQGIPGFPEEKSFTLLQLEQDSPFSILQSMQTPDLGFVVVNPFLFFKEYEFDLGEADKEKLCISSEEDVQVLSIVTLKDHFSHSTANLQAPLVLNTTKGLAKQIILSDPRYKTKHQLFAASAK